MADGIAKGIGEQLGNLGKQIVTEVAKTPAKIIGLDETLGSSSSKGAKGQKQTVKKATPQESADAKIAEIMRKDETEKQKQLARARQLLQQFINPPREAEPNLREKLEMEETEKKKQEIEMEKQKAKTVLSQVASKRPRGDLYGTRAKKFGGEVGKNVKSQ